MTQDEIMQAIGERLLPHFRKLALKPDGTIEDASADAIDERLASMGFGERVDRKHDIRSDRCLRMLPAPIRITTTVEFKVGS